MHDSRDLVMTTKKGGNIIMATPHNGAEKGQIAKSVLMPGDPLRAKFVAEHFLEDAKLVNTVRNAYAYTGGKYYPYRFRRCL